MTARVNHTAPESRSPRRPSTAARARLRRWTRILLGAAIGLTLGWYAAGLR